MKRYTFAELEAALPPAPAGTSGRRDNVFRLPGKKSAIFEHRTFPDMNAAASANLPRRRFEDLSAKEMNEILTSIVNHGPIAALAFGDRKEWLDLVFAFADAERCGATAARMLAREWSASAPSKFNEVHFDQDWASFQPGRITVGTLLRVARQTGFDFSPWFTPPELDPRAGTPPSPGGTANTSAPGGFLRRVPFARADRHPVPWMVRGLAVLGDVTVIAGPGGGAKTVMSVALLVCIAAGRSYWGSAAIVPRADGRPHRVAVISAEEDMNRLALLIAAACDALGFDARERADVGANLLFHDARQSGFRIGAPRPGQREDMAPETDDRACMELRDSLRANDVSLVVLDTLAALLALPSENDNSAATTLMRRIAKVAGEVGCAVILLHHTPKVTKEGAAAQRGEATAVRGGGAIVNSARIVWTITGLPVTEAGHFAMSGGNPDAIRRMDPVKLNDAAQPAPMFFEVVGIPVRVSDGTSVSVRAIRSIAAPQVGSGAIPDAIRNTAMKAIDAGAIVHGVKAPLTPGTGDRSAIDHVARALQAANALLSPAHAKVAAREVLTDLRDRLGCIKVVDVKIPKVRPDGSVNGFDKRKGLETRWHLAPWMIGQPAPSAPAAQPITAAPGGNPPAAP